MQNVYQGPEDLQSLKKEENMILVEDEEMEQEDFEGILQVELAMEIRQIVGTLYKRRADLEDRQSDSRDERFLRRFEDIREVRRRSKLVIPEETFELCEEHWSYVWWPGVLIKR